MKKMFLLAVAVLATMSLAQAQYHYDSTFPNTSSADSVLIVSGNGLHGVAVGADGNVWTVTYNTYIKGDSLKEQGTNVTKAVLPLRIWKPDGTPASFSPLMILKGTSASGAVTDTLFKGGIKGGTQGGTGRGLQTTPDGNILFTWFNNVYLLDYRTGAVLQRIITTPAHGSTAATADLSGDIFTAAVFPQEAPIEMWNKAAVKQGNVADTTYGFSRTIVCNRAGDQLFYAGYTLHCLIRYTGDPLLGFTPDTLFKGLDCESLSRAGKTDMIWASAGSGNDMPNRYPGFTSGWSSHAWYLLDPATKTVKDSVKWQGMSTFTNADSLGVRPRGVSTTVTGDTVYVIMFGGKTGMYNIQRFVKGAQAVHQNTDMVATSFTLEQNYPNPFNPSTNVQFALPQAGTITLKVYDVLGKEVATLAEGRYAAGTYTATFDAAGLQSGVYFYTLRSSNGFTKTNKMLLMK